MRRSQTSYKLYGHLMVFSLVTDLRNFSQNYFSVTNE